MIEHGMLRLPERIAFGSGCRAGIPAAAAEFGQRVYIIADPFLATTTEYSELISALEKTGANVGVYTDVPAELPVGALAVATRYARTFAPDVVIGYGGGSAIDAAKLVALQLSYPGPLSLFYGENAVPGPTVPLIAVPTTAGTGSEVTPVAVVSDPDRGTKVGISSPYLIPRRAFVDPELTLGVPSTVTAHSGIDAFVHAVESFTSRPLPVSWAATLPVSVGRNILSDALSLEAVRVISPNLERAVFNGNDRDARIAMAHGSLLAGMAFGATGVHLSHALQYPIGAATHTPHGLGTGMVLPYVLELCAQTVPERVTAIGAAMGIDVSDGGGVERTVDAIADLVSSIGLPASLAAIGVQRADLPRIAESAHSSSRLIRIAPYDVTAPILLTLLEAVYNGDRLQLRDDLRTRKAMR